MDLRLLATVFTTIFVARNPKLTVLLGSAAALTLASAIGVLAGAFVSEHLSERVLSRIAGIGFVAIGIWTLLRS